jgi:hypothetical protein
VSNQFFNQSLPQTLVIAQLLCYVDAFFSIVYGVPTYSPVLKFLVIFGLFIGGLGIANERKWGYATAVFASVLQVALYVAWFKSDVFQFDVLVTVLFDVALVALLLHPQSRKHQKVWFH